MLKYSSSPTGPRLPLAFQPRAPPHVRLSVFAFPPNCSRFLHAELSGSGDVSVQPHGLWGGCGGVLFVCFCFKLKSYSCESAVPVFVKLEKGCGAFACSSGVVPHCSPVSPHLICSSEPSKPALIRGRGASLADEGCKKLQVHTCERAAGMSQMNAAWPFKVSPLPLWQVGCLFDR